MRKRHTMTGTLELEIPALKEIVEEVGGNEDLLKEQMHKIRLWLKQQLHLPREISDQRLRFVICSSKFDLEKVKKRLDLHYTIRNLFPEISSLDPLGDDVTQGFQCIQMIALPQLTPQNYRVFMAQILNPDPSMLDMAAICKCVYLLLEILVEEDTATSTILILDTAKLSFAHTIKVTPNVLKRSEICVESYGRRIKAIYIVNAPSLMDKLMSVIKSVIKAKIVNRVHVYTSGIESLYGIVPKSILPADYGGEQPSTDIIAAMWSAKLAARRDWFLEQEKIRADESLRSNSVINPNDLFGVSGTFRKLDID